MGTSFGRGGATTFQQDLANADCIIIQGSNMAECHPVGFQWVMEAKARGAKIIHVDPRFTRTSALADMHVPLRAGTDIAFLGGLVNYIIEHDKWFHDYVVAYTNAPAIIDEGFADTEDLDGLFSGFDPATARYDNSTWQYAGSAAERTWEEGAATPTGEAQFTARVHQGRAAQTDETLQHPRCVFQLVKRHFARYTPQAVEAICGVPQSQFLQVAETLCANSGRDRTSAFCYAVGWTQHTVGVQYIRTAAIVQLLLGNIGRPGGGILALRGHASIQGSTDIPTLFNVLPGYLPMPHVKTGDTLDEYVDRTAPKYGLWGDDKKYVVSLLKAWFGDHADAANDYRFAELPRIDGDHSTYQSVMGMIAKTVKGFIVIGENPAVGSANSKLHRMALASLDWLVVRDFVEIETASFWYGSPEIETGELRTAEIGTEVFFMPAATHTEKDGTFTNTQRLLQWRHKAVEPKGDCRSDLWFAFHLGRIIREKLAGSTDPRDRLLFDLTWDYPTHGEQADPDAEAVLAEINGRRVGDGRALSTSTELADDGTTACGCWIYCGCYAGGVNQPARRMPGSQQSWVAPDWGWAWPANRRMLYNRASADPEGKPWSERKKYVWWDATANSWTGEDVPDFTRDKPPGYVPPEGARADAALRGDDPFILQADGKGWLFVPSGLVDGPLPVHYEPRESPVANALYGQRSNPVRVAYPGRDTNRFHPDHGHREAAIFPFVMTTYRLTEHHTAGGMSRFVPYLAELQPEMFCEVSPELAALRGLDDGGWATIVSSRTAIEARIIVTDRVPPLQVQGTTVHQVGLPYHWGTAGLSTGDSANDLFPLALDPNVYIQEVKAATCDVQPGRRPRGPALTAFVEDYCRRAGIGS